MHRSGSTLIYNLLRLTITELVRDGSSFSYGWVEDLRGSPRAAYTLIKLHAYEQELVDDASLIVYSYRDVRDAVASQQRKFGAEPTLVLADSYIEQYRQWENVAEIRVQYEALDGNRRREIVREVAGYLGSDAIDPDAVLTRLDRLSSGIPQNGHQYDPVTLFHPNHITDGRSGTWQSQLDTKLIAAIERKHGNWLSAHGYELLTR